LSEHVTALDVLSLKHGEGTPDRLIVKTPETHHPSCILQFARDLNDENFEVNMVYHSIRIKYTLAPRSSFYYYPFLRKYII